jgi:hypothetical protein
MLQLVIWITRPPGRPHGTTLLPLDRFLIKFDVSIFFENLSGIFKFNSNLARIMGTLHEEQYTYLIISRSVFLEWEIFQTNIVQKIETHILCSATFSENCIFYEIMWTNIVQPDRPQMKIQPMPIACWVPRTTNSHFSTATIAIRPRLNVTFTYIAGLGAFVIQGFLTFPDFLVINLLSF